MAGVEILAMEEVAVKFTFNWFVLWTSVGICMAIGLMIGAIVSIVTCDPMPFAVFFITAIFAGLIFGAIAGSDESVPTEYETQYKVTISDEVQMNDFLSRYEIISTEGRIYTVREINE